MDFLKLLEKLENAPHKYEPGGFGKPLPANEYRVILTEQERDLLIYCLNHRYSTSRHEDPGLQEAEQRGYDRRVEEERVNRR